MSRDGDVGCVKELISPAEIIINSGSGISRRNFEDRVELWNQIRNNYSRYENFECGTFDRTLDPHFRSKFEAALLTLCVSFNKNNEKFPESLIFSEDELKLYELIEMYQVLPSKRELMAILLSDEKGGSEFLNIHYRYIDSLVTEACARPGSTNQYLLQYIKAEWGKYDKRLQDVVIEAVQNNGLRWFIKYLGDGNERAEQIIYNISGGNVNLGNGVQIVGSLLNRTGITNEDFGSLISPGKTGGLSGGTNIQGSLVNRSTIGGDLAEEDKSQDRDSFCSSCGARLSNDARFCIECGKRVEF